MKALAPAVFDLARCREEVADLRDLLAKNATLKERETILPFFEKHPQLVLLCHFFNPNIAYPDLYARELELFGDYRADLVVGNSAKGAFCLVELEDATAQSIFKKQGKKATREWSNRFEHGFSQLVDWFCKIRDLEDTATLEAKFGHKRIDYEGLLVVGRSAHLDKSEVERLAWRKRHVLIDSKRAHCLTYDQLLTEFEARLQLLSDMSKPAN